MNSPGGVLWPLPVLLPACGWGHLDTVTPPDTEDTSDDDDASVDSDTPGPCGEGAPDGCAEIIDATCWVPALRPSQTGYRFDAHGTDVLAALPPSICDGLHMGDCNYFAALSCGDLVSTMLVPSEGQYRNEPVLYDQSGYQAHFYDVETGSIRSVGEVTSPQHREGPCPWTLYGDRAALPCFDRQRALVNERFASCASAARSSCDELCDVCPCRINELSDALPDGCESPSR